MIVTRCWRLIVLRFLQLRINVYQCHPPKKMILCASAWANCYAVLPNTKKIKHLRKTVVVLQKPKSKIMKSRNYMFTPVQHQYTPWVNTTLWSWRQLTTSWTSFIQISMIQNYVLSIRQWGANLCLNEMVKMMMSLKWMLLMFVFIHSIGEIKILKKEQILHWPNVYLQNLK